MRDYNHWSMVQISGMLGISTGRAYQIYESARLKADRRPDPWDERMSLRTVNRLRRNGINVPFDLPRMTDDEILALRDVGYGALAEIRQFYGREEVPQ
jgi:DNA-directed RNA polymerase alpha subunit